MTLKKLIGTASTIGALVAGLAVPFAGQASAATTPPWQPDANSSLGTVALYNAAGQRVTSGNDLSKIFTYAAASTASDRTGTTKATAFFSFPDHSKPDTSLWASIGASASTNYPNTAAPEPVKSLRTPVVTAGTGDADLTAALGNAITDPTAGYANIVEIRVKDSGPGVAPRRIPWWAVDISYNTAANTWTQVYPAVASGPTQTTTTLTASPVGHATPGSTVTLTATVTPTAAGTVQFKDGTTSVGTPVTVNAGTATTTTMPGTGSHSYTAMFMPTNSSSFAASTSAALAYSIRADATSLTIGRSTTITYGKTVAIATTLTDSDTRAVIGSAPVSLYAKAGTARTYSLLKTVTTASTGKASLTEKPTTTTSYQWRYVATTAHAAASSAVETVKVTQAVSAAASPARIGKRKIARVYGTVAPGSTGIVVHLQHKVGRRFVNAGTVRTARQKLPNGRRGVGYVFSIRNARAGTYIYRTVIAATRTLLGATSGVVAVKVV